jgi:hypothetical protein
MKSTKYAFMDVKLNLPACDFRVEKDQEGKLSIFDPLRKKFLILTPEEWVRQHLIWYLISEFHYPKSLFALERGLTYNTLQKRFDFMVLDQSGSPFLLVECKSPDIRLSQQTVEQVAVYNTQVKAPYIGISNGIQHLFLSYSPEGKNYLQLREIPAFTGSEL